MDYEQRARLLKQIRKQIDNAYDRAPGDTYVTSLLLALYKIADYLEQDAGAS